jgi:hypothetical protein
MQSGFEADNLWAKSKIYFDKALVARDEQDDASFHLWSAIALELLGKAALATIHPALVADPSDIKSLLAACGISTTTQLKSITAKTVFERLKTTCREFDGKRADECMAMMNRRNAELHSGQTPTLGLNQKQWVPVFWKNVSLLLATQTRTLEELLGPNEALRVEAILQDSRETGRQTVLARIERRRQEFKDRCPKGSQQLKDARRRADQRPEPISLGDFKYQEVECPACKLPAWLEGEEWNRETIDTIVDEDEDWGGYFDVVLVTYGVERFECPECSLDLRGQEEVAIAGLPTDFEERVEEDPDYEPDFGND